MQHIILNEFDVRLDATTDTGKTSSPPVTLLTITHRASGHKQQIRFLGKLSDKDTWIKSNIHKYFPTTASAAAIRGFLTHDQYRLRDDWAVALNEKFYFALYGVCSGAGARFWANSFPLLPGVLAQTLITRSAKFLSSVGTDASLYDMAVGLKRTWYEVCREIRILDGLKDIRLTILHKKGWPVSMLEPLSISQLIQLRTQCTPFLDALDFLSISDWAAMLVFVIEPLADSKKL